MTPSGQNGAGASDDWRLTNQESYLARVALVRKRYRAKSEQSEHEHCSFCWAKFMDPEFSPEHARIMKEDGEILSEGYATTADHPDGEDYWWICEPCFLDFRERFGWQVLER